MNDSPKFSVVMPSYLGYYVGAASMREMKIRRAIESVLNQTFGDLELIVIADGCEKTVEIVSGYDDDRIKGFLIPKQKLWSGIPRNVGIAKSRGEWIMYLDVDDVYIDSYLEDLNNALGDKDWYWMHELSYNKQTGQFDTHICDITRFARCGTSNIIHRKIAALWPEKGKYDHDWQFISALKRASKRYDFLDVTGYGVMHVPDLLDE